VIVDVPWATGVIVNVPLLTFAVATPVALEVALNVALLVVLAVVVLLVPNAVLPDVSPKFTVQSALFIVQV
jgi:hypothetical protein